MNIAVAKASKAAEYGYISQSVLEAFKEQKSIEALNDYASAPWYDAVNQYLSMAEKIQKLTKDRDFVLPEVSDTEEVSDQSSDQSEVSGTTSQSENKDGNTVLPIIIGAATVIAVAAIVIELLKNKK